MTMTTTLADEIEELTKEAVQRVFQTMLSMEISTDEWPPDGIPVEMISAVGFIGRATGSVYLCADAALARTIASQMLGLSESEIESDEMVNDVMGEVSNMIVGQVKSHLCDHGHSCTLTIPSIVRGQ